MANLFGHLHMEDRTSDFPEGTLITEGDEGESVAAAVAEVTEEEAGIVEDEREMDNFTDNTETADELVEAVEEAPKTESAGLTQTNARLLSKVLKHLGGNAYVKHAMPKMEHFEGRANRREATQLVFENVTDSLKGFWEALKKQFMKLWAKIKTWYVKTFSAAKRLSERAKSVRDRAENMSATIDKKSFQFGQTKVLAIDGKLKDATAFATSLELLSGLVEVATEVDTEGAFDKLDKALDQIKGSITKQTDAQGNKSFEFNGASDIITILTSKFDRYVRSGGSVDDKVRKSLGADAASGGETQIEVSPTLPGDKVFVAITPSAAAAADINKTLRITRTVIVNTKDKPREIDGNAEVVTLNPAQIAKFADIITSSAGDIATYEQKWERVDKSQNQLIRKIDEIFKDIQGDLKDDDDSSSSNERDARTLATNVTNFAKRTGQSTGQITSLAMTVYAATLNWCEGSMRNYKK